MSTDSTNGDAKFRWTDAALVVLCAYVWPHWYGWPVAGAWMALEVFRIQAARRLHQGDGK